MSNEAKFITGVILATVLIVVVAIFATGSYKASGTPDNSVATPPPANAAFLVREDSQKFGSESAKVTMVEFADYQCPGCKGVYPILKQLKEEYKNDMQFVFRNFPLPMHPLAQQAAETAEIAGSQGKFWEMHDMIFDNQESLTKDSFEQFAKDLELDMDAYNKAISDGEYKKKVQRDLSDASQLDLQGTPTIFINTIPYTGPLSYEGLKQAIDSELQK